MSNLLLVFISLYAIYAVLILKFFKNLMKSLKFTENRDLTYLNDSNLLRGMIEKTGECGKYISVPSLFYQ